MLLIDMHCDTIFELMRVKQGDLRENALCVNIDHLKKANSMAQFMACFVYARDFDFSYTKAYGYALEMLDYGRKEIEANKTEIGFALHAEDIDENQRNGLISAVLTIEEGGILEHDLSRLDTLYDKGVRLMTLTWNYENCIGYPNKMVGGLKPFGIEVVQKMNDLGMLIDVSHLSDEGFWDVIRYSKKPIVASHSNARSLCNHPRNLTDEMIKTLAENGGVMGINFYPYFVSENGVAMVEDIGNHIEHIYRVGGEEVLAIGTDFDGFDEGELEIGNIGEIEKLYVGLKRRGLTERQLEKIWHQNAMRVIKEGI